MTDLDIVRNRAARKYSRRENLERVLWAMAAPLFRYSPRVLYSWRNMLLRLFGARIGRDVRVYPSVRVFLPGLLLIGDETTIGDDVRLYNLGRIEIAAQVTISQGAHLCAGSHDHQDRAFPLIRASITIGRSAWVCADAFIGPGVQLGEGAVVGARAVAMRDVPAWQIVAGNPAAVVGTRVLKPTAAT